MEDCSRSWKLKKNPACRQIKTYCYEGWPDKHSLKDAIKPYHLAVQGRTLCYTEHVAKSIQDHHALLHVFRIPQEDPCRTPGDCKMPGARHELCVVARNKQRDPGPTATMQDMRATQRQQS